MLRKVQRPNNTISEEMMQELRVAFRKFSPELHPIPLSKLPELLHDLKIQIPDSMLKDYHRWLSIKPTPKFSIKQFSNMVARAIIQEQVEEQIRSLFYNIDKENDGCLDAQDLHTFIKDMDGGNIFNEEDVDELIREIDQLKIGHITYEDLVYALLPK